MENHDEENDLYDTLSKSLNKFKGILEDEREKKEKMKSPIDKKKQERIIKIQELYNSEIAYHRVLSTDLKNFFLDTNECIEDPEILKILNSFKKNQKSAQRNQKGFDFPVGKNKRLDEH